MFLEIFDFLWKFLIFIFIQIVYSIFPKKMEIEDFFEKTMESLKKCNQLDCQYIVVQACIATTSPSPKLNINQFILILQKIELLNQKLDIFKYLLPYLGEDKKKIFDIFFDCFTTDDLIDDNIFEFYKLLRKNRIEENIINNKKQI